MSIEVEAQITGNIWKIEKAVGDKVNEGDILIIMESMKMEIPVESPGSGRLKEFKVQEGDTVEEGEILAIVD